LQPGGKDFSKEEIQALQHKINKGKKGKIPFTNQMVDYVMMGGSLVKKDTMDSILSNLRTVARRHGLSSRLFNDPQASTFNNMISDERRAWEDCIKPMVEHSKDEFNAWLCAPWGVYMEPNYKNVAALQKDMKEVADALSKMSFLTVGEKYRLAEITPDNPDDPELEQRQVALVPTGTPLEDDESATAKALGIYGISSNGKKAKTVA
jgi:phage portal protein BeeE